MVISSNTFKEVFKDNIFYFSPLSTHVVTVNDLTQETLCTLGSQAIYWQVGLHEIKVIPYNKGNH